MNHIGTQRIETERIILRPFTMEDAQLMYDNWASDPTVTHFLTWPTHANVDVTRDILRQWTHLPPNEYQWCIEIDGEPRGSIGTVSIDEENGTLEIGYCLSQACWGKGYMPEVVHAVIQFLFDKVGAKRILAKHDVENPNSGKVMKKAGMSPLEVRHGVEINLLGKRDCAVWYIDRQV